MSDDELDDEKIYDNGIVYAIIGLETGKMYVGSTTKTLNKRISNHINSKDCMCIDIIDNEQYEIDILETFENITKKNLVKEESKYQYNLKDMIINNRIEGRTKEEWYKDNKEKLLIYHKKWYENNKILHNENRKNYRKNNRKEINKKDKNYYDNNKDKILKKQKEKYSCECGKNDITKHHKSRHEKSKYHQDYIYMSKIKFKI